MAFGLLTTKWRILKSSLKNSFETNSHVIQACALLHNFVINQDWEDTFDEIDNDDKLDIACQIEPLESSPLGWGYLPTVWPLEAIPGTSRIRDVILGHIAESGYCRPDHNIECCCQELHDMEMPLM